MIFSAKGMLLQASWPP